MRTITTVTELEQFGVPVTRDRDKVLSSLQDVHLEWLAACSLIFVATADAAGRCDVSPKGDPPGFVVVLGPHQLLIPERPGNRRMDGFHNLVENPHAGLMCLVPGRRETLRINGGAQPVTDLPDLATLHVNRHQPRLGLLVDVEEVFFHCPRAFQRSRTWEPDSWNPASVRPYVDIALALWRKDEPEAEVRRHYARAAVDSAAALYRD